MKYRLNHQGQDLGEFTLEELQRRRQSGELQGTEWVLAEGASEWKALDFILEVSGKGRSTPPPVPASARKRWNRPLVWVIGVVAVLLVAGLVGLGIAGYRFAQRVRTVMRQVSSDQTGVTLASQPVNAATNSLTEADVQKRRRAFRVRQYLDGFNRDGPAKARWRDDALLLIESWLAQHYGGDDRTNLPSPADLGDKLVAAGCRDPLVLTVAGVNCEDWNEATRRLKRAVNRFEQSDYKAYPRLYATVLLADRFWNQTNRVKEFDAAALGLLGRAFADGSFLPDDQAEAAEIFVAGWGKTFFGRNPAAVIERVRAAGKSFEWLALVLEGASEVDAAWRARGSGWASSVTAEGWQGFADHLAQARKPLTEAWKLRPDLPFAPSRMIAVAMGQSDAEEMRLWFDRATAAQFDHPQAWSALRWGLRPRWLGSEEAVLALGIMGLNTGRFDTDVPRKLLEAIHDVESDRKLPVGEHLYGQPDLWPHVRKMFEGYIAANSNSALAGSWRSDYAVVAYLAGHYDLARQQLEAVRWQPWPGSTKHWGRDLSLLAEAVAALTSPLGRQVAEAEAARRDGDLARAWQLYSELSAATNVDQRARRFIQAQTALVQFEQRLAKNDWVDFLPTDEGDDNWALGWAEQVRVTTNVLEVQSGRAGHLLYARANLGPDFEARGEFEIVKSSGPVFEAGLVLGMPDFDTRFRSSYWFPLRMRRDASEGDRVIFSKGRTRRELAKTVKLNGDRNSFQVRFAGGKVTVSLNGAEVFRDAELQNAAFTGDTMLAGVCALGDSGETVIRYRHLQVRRLASPSPAEKE
jgi:hypothetical protein